MPKTNYQSIDEYIHTFPKDVQKKIQKIRQTIRNATPEAEEAIRYQMPTFRLNGNLIHFAAYKNHISFYPTPSGTTAFREELEPCEWVKGSSNFRWTSRCRII